MEQDQDVFLMPENHEPMKQEFTVTKLAHGLGFGEGSISTTERLNDPYDITPETLAQVEEALHSDEILVDVDVTDDGCGDGRGVKRVFVGAVEKMKSLNRSKVFGGGLTMAVASAIGMGKAAGKKLKDTFSTSQTELDEQDIDYGAHTDDHAEGPNSGCGAIDKAPSIISNTVKFRDGITTAIGLLTGSSHDTARLDRIFDNFEVYADEIKEDQTYAGRNVSEKIMDKEKVVKELEGPHLEVAIGINTISGKTINQDLIRRITDSKAQIFAVDEWRIREIADELYDTPEEREEAYLSMLVYTLATAATLTKGDHPVYLISAQPELQAA